MSFLHTPQRQNYHHHHSSGVGSGSSSPTTTASANMMLSSTTTSASASPDSSNATIHSTNSAAAMMERVVFQLHYRICCMVCNTIPSNIRLCLEYILLVLAILGFGALILLHKSFVFHQDYYNHQNIATTCLAKYYQDHLATQTTQSQQSVDLLYISIMEENDTTPTTWIQTSPTTTTTTAETDDETCTETGTTEPAERSPEGTCSQTSASSSATQQQQHVEYPHSSYQYAFSTTQSYLLLPPDHWLFSSSPAASLQQQHHQHHPLTIHHVFINRKDPNCFGEPFLQSLLWNWLNIDVDVLVQNWCLGMLASSSSTTNDDDEDYGSIGYLWKANHPQAHLQELVVAAPSSPSLPTSTTNPRLPSRNRKQRQAYPSRREMQQQREHHQENIMDYYSYYATLLLKKMGRLIQIACLFFFCTTLVSFTLTETQERMLWFTQELRRRVQVNLPVTKLVTTHLLQTFVFVPIMVGMIFFLMECYQGDKVLAFLQLTIVWCVEVFSVLSLRSYHGMTFFPKIFFLLFCLFHVYHFANPYGFGYTALAVIACFMLHSMFFFWNRYELPAVALGFVTVDRPRHVHVPNNNHNGGATPPNATTTTTSHLQQPPAQQNSNHTATPRTPPRRTSTASRSLFPSTADSNSTTADSSSNNGSSSSLRGEALLFGATSYASFSSSQRTGSSGAFRINPNGDDDDDDDSFVYFMEGEVVLRRNASGGTNSQQRGQGVFRSNGSSSNNNGTDGTSARPGDLTNTPVTTNTTASNSSHNNSSSVGLNVEDDDEEEDVDVPSPPSGRHQIPPPHPLAAVLNGSASTGSTSTPYYSGESGGLQAILEVRLTPRHRNSSSSGNPNNNPQAASDAAMESSSRRSLPPTFPVLPS